MSRTRMNCTLEYSSRGINIGEESYAFFKSLAKSHARVRRNARKRVKYFLKKKGITIYHSDAE